MEPHPIKCRVEVNQRQLIYKILSRYSAEFTAFRELLQNADDACASCVLITVTNACVCVRNNGNVFEEEDWKRLSSIASGNPNEEAIGFFGVGFYSVFSLSDSPIVSSGSTSMRFFFEGDALYTETSTLSAPQAYTEVQCELKPGVGGWDVNRLSDFLESSMSFPRCIAEVSLTVNDSFKFGIARETSGATALNTTSSQKINSLFNIQAACIRNLRITVKENNSNRTSALTEVSCTVSLKDSNFGLLLGRTMGKNMPVSVPLRLLYPETSDKTRQFMGKIFIGFSTTQTTGSGFHVSSRFIPTVERDSIDMHSPVISVWNRALVSASGSLSRGFYDQCITLSSSDEQEQLLTLHEFKDSAPHVAVSRLLASAFVQNNPILIPSSMGAKPSAEVYILPPPFNTAPHLKLPVVSGPLAESAQKTLHLLETQKRLLRFGVDDLIKSNQKQLFSYLEGSEMLCWFTSSKVLLGSHQNWMQLVKKVLQSMRLVRPDKQSTDLLCLGSITNHISGDPLSYINVPLPASTLPAELSNALSQADLNTLGLSALQFVKWWNYIRTLPVKDLFEDKTMSPRLLSCISRYFDSCLPDQKKEIQALLSSTKCIPVENGSLMKPTEVYFEDTPIFSDLPHVVLDGVSQSFLKFLGVREEPDVKLVLDRLGELKWPMEQLVRYFKGRTLPEAEWATLRTRVKKGFYTPDPILEAMGFPVVPWRGVLQPDEKSFLELLGVPSHPPLDVILSLCGSNPKTMAFFIEKFDSLYKATYSASVQVAFLPVHGNPSLALPSKCCIKEVPPIFGYHWLDTSLVSEEFAAKLGVPLHPPVDVLKNTITRNPITDSSECQKVFSYLKGVPFASADYVSLQQSPFIFCDSINRFVAPRDVFILNPATQKQFGDILNYVNFGQEANSFLKLCGVKDSPNPDELAENIMNNSGRFTQKLKEPTRYLAILRTLAQGIAFITEETKTKLKAAKVFVGLPPKGSWGLFNASSCFIVDNKRLADLFSPIATPRDLGLHDLYYTMGSNLLSLAVHISYKPLGYPKTTLHAKALQQTIRLRAPLLLNNLEGNFGQRDNLKEDAVVWCGSCIVVVVEKIVEELRFGSETRTLAATACHQKQTLFLTADEQTQARLIGKVVAQAILKSPTLDQCAFFSIVLSEPLDVLRKRDIPVDRFLPPYSPDILSAQILAAIRIQSLFRGYMFRRAVLVKQKMLQLSSPKEVVQNEQQQKDKSLRNIMHEERTNPTPFPIPSATLMSPTSRLQNAPQMKTTGNSDIKNNRVRQATPVQERMDTYLEARARIFADQPTTQVPPYEPAEVSIGSEGEYDSADEGSDDSGEESVHSSDLDERRMRRRDRRRSRDEGESEGSTVDSQLDSASEDSERSYDTPLEDSEGQAHFESTVEWWNDVDKKEHLTQEQQRYHPGSYYGGSQTSHETSFVNPPASNRTNRPPYVITPDSKALLYATSPKDSSEDQPTLYTNNVGTSLIAGVLAEDHTALQHKYLGLLEHIENLRSQVNLVTSQRDEARRRLAETAAYLQDKKVLIPELHTKLNDLQQQLHALGLAHPQLQHLLDPIVSSAVKLCQLSSPHVPLPTPPRSAKPLPDLEKGKPYQRTPPKNSQNGRSAKKVSAQAYTLREPRQSQAPSQTQPQTQPLTQLFQSQQPHAQQLYAQQSQTQQSHAHQSHAQQSYTQQSQAQSHHTQQMISIQPHTQVQPQVHYSGKASPAYSRSPSRHEPKHSRNSAPQNQATLRTQQLQQCYLQAQALQALSQPQAQPQSHLQVQLIQAQLVQAHIQSQQHMQALTSQYMQQPTFHHPSNRDRTPKSRTNKTRQTQSPRHQPQPQPQNTIQPSLPQPPLTFPLHVPLSPPIQQPQHQHRDSPPSHKRYTKRNTQAQPQPPPITQQPSSSYIQPQHNPHSRTPSKRTLWQPS